MGRFLDWFAQKLGRNKVGSAENREEELELYYAAGIMPLPIPDMDVFKSEFKHAGSAVRLWGHLSQGTFFVAQGGLQFANRSILSNAFFSGELPPGADRMQYGDGTVGSVLMGSDSKISGHQGFSQGNGTMELANAVAGVMNIASMVVGQYFMSQINDKLADLDQKLDELLLLHQDEMMAKLISAQFFLKRVNDEMSILCNNDTARTAAACQLNAITLQMDNIKLQCLQHLNRQPGRKQRGERKDDQIERMSRESFYMANYICACQSYSALRVALAALYGSDEYNDLVKRDLTRREEEDSAFMAQFIDSAKSYVGYGKKLFGGINALVDEDGNEIVYDGKKLERAYNELLGALDPQIVAQATSACCLMLDKMSDMRKGVVIHEGQVYIPNTFAE